MGIRLIIGAVVFSLWAQSAGAVFQQGVDVYSGQGAVSWSSMKSGGISFAFVKATEGQNFVDTQFTTNMANAKSAGVLIGLIILLGPTAAIPIRTTRPARQTISSTRSVRITRGQI